MTDRRALVSLVRSVEPSQLTARLQSRVVDRFKDVAVQLLGFVALKRKAHHQESIGETLNADSDRPMALVALLSLKK